MITTRFLNKNASASFGGTVSTRILRSKADAPSHPSQLPQTPFVSVQAPIEVRTSQKVEIYEDLEELQFSSCPVELSDA